MTINELTPAIGGLLFAALGWAYALHLKRKLVRDRERRRAE